MRPTITLSLALSILFTSVVNAQEAAPLLVPVANDQTNVTAPTPVPELESTRSLLWLQITGAVTWGAAYLATIAVTGAVGSLEEVGLNAIPLAGPWMCLAGMCEDPDPYAAALIASGVVQAAGLSMLIIGSVIRVRVPQENRSLRTAWDIRPWTSANLVGAELALRF